MSAFTASHPPTGSGATLTPTPAEFELARQLVEWLESEVPSLLIPAPANVANFLAAHRAAPTVTESSSMKMRDGFAELIGEGIHTCLRKLCESREAQDAYADIAAMPDSEWSNVCKAVSDEIMKYYRLSADPAVAHAPELEIELKHIQEMAAEDIRMGDAGGAIWQIEANARSLLAMLDAERKAVTS